MAARRLSCKGPASFLRQQVKEIYKKQTKPTTIKQMKKLEQITNLKEAIIQAEREYKYQPELTDKLNNHSGDFTEQTLLEIVLWKTNRYPKINGDTLDNINDLRKSYTEEKARNLLSKLLESKGFDLPMASTVLRFAVPEHLQIIDQRAYRLVINDKDSLKIPYNINKKIDLYFNYIQCLKNECAKYGIPFSKADKILYQLDKTENKEIGLTTYSLKRNLL